MTKSRKIAISVAVALTLVFVLTCAVFVPMFRGNANVAHAVVVQSRNEWSNTYSGTYYDNLNTGSERWGTTFYNDLAKLITDTHTRETGYNELKTLFQNTDADPDNSGNVFWFYTGNSVKYNGVMDTNSGYPTGYPSNREHVWPKMGGDAFPEESQAGSDAHHLRPLNSGLNNTRSNNHFGEVPQTTGNRVAQTGTLSSYGTSDPDTWCYQATVNGTKLFYPAKGYRGATARILFYVQTRWGKGQSTGDLSFTLGNGSARVMSNVDTLLKWHLEEPPTDEEIRRNEVVFGIQHNRNPFIDHPEYAEMIYCYNGASYNNTLKDVVRQYGSYLDNGNQGGDNPTPPSPPALTGLTLSPTSLSLTVGQTASVTVTAQPTGAISTVTWSSSNSDVADVNGGGVVTAIGVGTATITATSAVNSSIKAELTVTVISQAENANIFENSIKAIQAFTEQTTLEQRYSAIRAAIVAYNNMSEAEKNSHSSDYQTLVAAMEKYNEDVAAVNGEFASANNLAAQLVSSGAAVSFLALLALVVRRLTGR